MCWVTRDENSPLFSDTDLPLNPQQIHKAFVFLWHVVSCAWGSMLPSPMRDGHQHSVYGNITFFVLLQDMRRPEKHKSLAFPLCLWHLQRDKKHGGCATHLRLVPKKRFPIELSQQGTVPWKNPILFFLFNFCSLTLLPCILVASSWTGWRDAQPTDEEGGEHRSRGAPVSHNWMSFRMKTQGCH